MRRIVGLLVALLVVAGAVPAMAKPEIYPPEYWELAFTEDGLCPFAVDVELSGKEGAILFWEGDTIVRGILTAPGFRAKLSANGEEMDLSISGSFHERYEGDLAIGKATGRNVLVGTFGGDPGMFLTIGKVEYEFDLVTEDYTILNSHKMIDLCEALAG